MIDPLSAGEVGYHGRDDVVLRGALYEVYNGICVACDLPKTFADTEIDHLISKDVNSAELQSLIVWHGRPADFHRHRPANLALICGPCNRKKSNRNPRAMSLTVLLDRAAEHADTVVRLVEAHTTARQVARGLTAAVRANLRDPQARTEFLQHAPAVVQTLALLDETKADFVITRHAQLYLSGDVVAASLRLDGRGRIAYAWIEEICGSSWTDVVEDGLHEVVTTAEERADEAVDVEAGETGNVGSTRTDELHATLSITGWARHGTRLIVDFAGMLYGRYSGEIADTNPWDDEASIIDLQAWVEVEAGFRMSACWDLTTGPGDPAATTTEVTLMVSESTKSRA